MTTPPPGINPIPLERIRTAGGDALAKKILDLFLHHGPARLVLAREAVAGGNAEALEQCMHSLKSSAAQLGAEQLAEICRDLEARAKAGNLAGTEPLVKSAEDAMKVYALWAAGS